MRENGGIEGSCDNHKFCSAMAKERPEMPAPAMMIFLPDKRDEESFVVVFSILSTVLCVYDISLLIETRR